MGDLMSRFQSDPNPLEVFVDFESSEPAEGDEATIYKNVEEVLTDAPTILKQLVDYKGCGELIRKSINDPSDENQAAAWEAVVPMVNLLLDFHKYAARLESVVPILLRALCINEDAETNLQEKQALTRQLATIFDFVMRFDDAKMMNPAIQNDFSYYRRTLNKMKNTVVDFEAPIDDNTANAMSLFYAYPTPMVRCLSEAVVNLVSDGTGPVAESVPRANVTAAFAMMANVCYSMVATQKFTTVETNMFCLRSMVAATIIFDHTDPQGAFCKKSPIHIKPVIQTLKGYEAAAGETDSLINALRFTSVHLNDDDTPNSVKNLLL